MIRKLKKFKLISLSVPVPECYEIQNGKKTKKKRNEPKRNEMMCDACNINNDLRCSRDYVEYSRYYYIPFALPNVTGRHIWIERNREPIQTDSRKFIR